MNKQKLIPSFIIGAAITAAILIFLRIWESPGIGRTFHILTDSFFVAAVILLGIGFLRVIKSTGFFNIFGYSKELFLSSVFTKRKKSAADFYEYQKNFKGRADWHMVIVGAFFLLVSLVFLGLTGLV